MSKRTDSRHQKEAIIHSLRDDFLNRICSRVLGFRKDSDVPSNADKDSRLSVEIAKQIFHAMKRKGCKNPPSAQSSGSIFTEEVKTFIQSVFEHLAHIRPGPWKFSASQATSGISDFDQYRHVAELVAAAKTNKVLRSVIGSDYYITPDITIARIPLDEKAINAGEYITDISSEIAGMTPLRATSGTSTPILHASISCKWTMRSDRAQNSRTEALNLIRNRKGRTPHICAVTMEPLPSRVASLAFGTGDIDCTYHGALYELISATDFCGDETQKGLLEDMINGRRLRDISDLPFDLAI